MKPLKITTEMLIPGLKFYADDSTIKTQYWIVRGYDRVLDEVNWSWFMTPDVVRPARSHIILKNYVCDKDEYEALVKAAKFKEDMEKLLDEQ